MSGAALALTGCLVACEDTIFVSTGEDTGPPTIIAQGPDFPQGTILWTGGSTPAPWVVVGDPDGLDDIAAVFVEIETVRFHEVIMRADTSTSGCASFMYVANNIVDTTFEIPVPVDTPGTQSLLSHDEGGIYRMRSFRFPYIPDYFPTFSRGTNCATSGGAFGRYLDWYTIVSQQLTVFLTSVDVEYEGITVTAYDKIGGSATAIFPDLRIVYSTSEEVVTPP